MSRFTVVVKGVVEADLFGMSFGVCAGTVGEATRSTIAVNHYVPNLEEAI